MAVFHLIYSIAPQLRFDEAYDDDEDVELISRPSPEYACTYCGISNPSCVVKCLNSGKWFCNGKINRSGSCIVLHLVKSKQKEVQLHKDSPLGDAVLECYASGTRNVFVLGFVPVKSENTVVLLARGENNELRMMHELSPFLPGLI